MEHHRHAFGFPVLDVLVGVHPGPDEAEQHLKARQRSVERRILDPLHEVGVPGAPALGEDDVVVGGEHELVFHELEGLVGAQLPAGQLHPHRLDVGGVEGIQRKDDVGLAHASEGLVASLQPRLVRTEQLFLGDAGAAPGEGDDVRIHRNLGRGLEGYRALQLFK